MGASRAVVAVESEDDYETFCNKLSRSLEIGSPLRYRHADLKSYVFIVPQKGMVIGAMPEHLFLQQAERMRMMQSLVAAAPHGRG